MEDEIKQYRILTVQRLNNFGAKVPAVAEHLPDEFIAVAGNNCLGLPFRSKLKNPFDDNELIFLRIQRTFIAEQSFSGSDPSLDKIVYK